MVWKPGQAALDQRYCIVVTLRQLTPLRGEIQLFKRHGHVRRCLYQKLSCACMIALCGGDVTEARKRFTVVGDACENTVQQTCSIIKLTSKEVLLGGGESVFIVHCHGIC